MTILRACGAKRRRCSVPSMLKTTCNLLALCAACLAMTQCASPSGNLGGPTPEVRNATIASEPSGDFFYGRRYFVEKTRFWGYLRQPRQPWNRAKLVILCEDKMRAPDRLPEYAPPGKNYAYDNNYDYRIHGYYTGSQAYEPNSNQFLPVFMLTGYEVLDRQPGWLFRPDDRYDRFRITMYPR